SPDSSPPHISTLSLHDALPISPVRDNVSKLEPATTIPDMLPPAAPPNAIKTSIVPWVLARISGSVESTINAVPLIKPKFQPKPRSEEHTSELQSRFDLVCRLLL